MQNAPFDLNILHNEGLNWVGKIVDTLTCAKHLLPTKRHSLQYLRYELELYKFENDIAKAMDKKITAHDALSDVIVTKLLLSKLLQEVDNDIENLITLTDTPILLKVIQFGKYKGKNFEDMVNSDEDYFYWALRNIKNMSGEVRATIKHYLGIS